MNYLWAFNNVWSDVDWSVSGKVERPPRKNGVQALFLHALIELTKRYFHVPSSYVSFIEPIHRNRTRISSISIKFVCHIIWEIFHAREGNSTERVLNWSCCFNFNTPSIIICIVRSATHINPSIHIQIQLNVLTKYTIIHIDTIANGISNPNLSMIFSEKWTE